MCVMGQFLIELVHDYALVNLWALDSSFALRPRASSHRYRVFSPPIIQLMNSNASPF